ncbi:hypothetical protein N0O92_10305 [Alkalihalobacillus sp. MEB130]|uniref:hypothetical protein n=1 Tax=Alkalihalobacillus sp. MEB130 TaxID=2976704 RepID=UPI0028DDAEDF|nr:hypothetical protein [Alkalihalobacillus sp. MEB130]MDT8860626.1 hypothetical protein [Alkalihalobacillus sp. MEB130]
MTLKQKNTFCLVIVSLIMLAPIFIMLVTGERFVTAIRLFPLDFSLYFAVLLGAIIVNYSMRSTKLLTITMLATVGGLAFYFFGYL